MEKTQFWQLIEQSQNKTGDCNAQAAQLQKLLSQLDGDHILQFSQLFDQFSNLAYSWELWAVAYIINGGASDDGFQYFRWWLIAQGQNYFEAALENPERAADGAEFEEAECEGIAYCINDAYQEKTGEDLPVTKFPTPENPMGQRWDEEDLAARFPQLCEKFG